MREDHIYKSKSNKFRDQSCKIQEKAVKLHNNGLFVSLCKFYTIGLGPGR